VGDLGSGKTCFVQGLGKGLGVADPIVSPTFLLIREYPATDPKRPALYHVDLYRLAAADIPCIGLDEYLDRSGVVAIEWADHMGESGPAECLYVEFRYVDDTKRDLRFSAHGQRYATLLDQYKRVLFGT
jgi:tRNA threonylcarbamoyladenosine biosynthesis protein TsaE